VSNKNIHLYFKYVKEAFIYVFKNALGTNFTTEVSDAWDLAFQYIAKKMLEGMSHSGSA
jgi:hemoglobin-like flavoprotein